MRAERSISMYFYPRPPRGGRRPPPQSGYSIAQFLSTPSARRATPPHHSFCPQERISIHALREEGDWSRWRKSATLPRFLSTPSARRATNGRPKGKLSGTISIHALREEGDTVQRKPNTANRNFYPRPPRGGRPHRGRSVRPGIRISIHALREEGDASSRPAPRAAPIFLSTPSARRATGHHPERGDRSRISIHALREEGDAKRSHLPCAGDNFYPRPPRGGRRQVGVVVVEDFGFLSTPSARRATLPRSVQQPAEEFLSTPSARRATFVLCILLKEASISIHALREEGDPLGLALLLLLPDFYPRPPRGGRRAGSVRGMAVNLFLSTPSARRATFRSLPYGSGFVNFYPRPPRGGRQQKQRQNLYFQTNCTTFCTNLEEP